MQSMTKSGAKILMLSSKLAEKHCRQVYFSDDQVSDDKIYHQNKSEEARTYCTSTLRMSTYL